MQDHTVLINRIEIIDLKKITALIYFNDFA